MNRKERREMYGVLTKAEAHQQNRKRWAAFFAAMPNVVTPEELWARFAAKEHTNYLHQSSFDAAYVYGAYSEEYKLQNSRPSYWRVIEKHLDGLVRLRKLQRGPIKGYYQFTQGTRDAHVRT